MNRHLPTFSATFLAFVFVVGCTTTKAGSPSIAGPTGSSAATQSSGTVPSSAPAATNAPPNTSGFNYRTVDPCSFLAKNAFDQLIKNQTGEVTFSDYSNCQLSIAGLAGTKAVAWGIVIDMSATFTTAAELQAIEQTQVSTKKVQGTAIFEGISRAAGCLRAFQLPYVNATLVLKAKGKSLQCEAADAMLTSALKAVSTGDGDPLKLPANSLGAADICAHFLPQATSLLGSDLTGQAYGVHGCRWTTSAQVVMLASLVASRWPPASFPPAAKKSAASGHPVLSVINVADKGVYAQGAVNFEAGTVGEQGTTDVFSVICTAQGSGDKIRSGFVDFLGEVAGSKLK